MLVLYALQRTVFCPFQKKNSAFAEFYSLPILDLYASAGIQPQLEAHKVRFAPDGLHPNNAGAEKLADRLGAYLLSL